MGSTKATVLGVKNYICETMRNAQVRIDERSKTCKDSEHDYEAARHLRENALYFFSWRIVYTTQSFHKRIILGGSSNNGNPA